MKHTKGIFLILTVLLLLFLPVTAWAMPTIEAQPPPRLALTADKYEVSPGDTISIKADFDVLAGVIYGYSTTRLTVVLPAGLTYYSSVAYIGGAPVVVATMPISTPVGTSATATFDNNTPGAAQLIITANVGGTWDGSPLEVKAELYLQPTGADMPNYPNARAAVTIRAAYVAPVTPQVATVTFDPRGGVRTGGGQLVQTVSIGYPAVEPYVSRSGYVFGGWDTPFSYVTQNITVTAIWTPEAPQIVTVTFNLNGGRRTGGGELVQSVSIGYSAVEPYVTRQGYVFAGWDTPFTNVRQNITVSAMWTPDVTPVTPQLSTVTFNLAGGTRVGGGALIQVIPTGQAAVEPYVFRQGYIFTGWSVPFNYITRDITVTARWTPEADMGLIVEPPIYTLVQGSFINDRDTFTQFSHMPLIFYADRHVAHFTSVEVDGITITPGTHFIATTGTAENTTAIHLKASYLNTVAAGTHTLRVNFRDGAYVTAPFTMVLYKNLFYDVTVGDWFYSGVGAMNASELMRGVTETQFDPYSHMTRGMVVTLLYRFAGEPSIAGFANPFPDVAAAQYYTNAVMWAAANGIVVGHPDGTFAPNDMMTREQFATVLYRYQNALGSITMDILMDYEHRDFAQISDYAKSPVTKLTMQGVFRDWPVDGGRFNPAAPVSRAEVAAVMRHWIESIGW